MLENKKAIIFDFDGVLCFLNWNYKGTLYQWKQGLWDLLEEYEPGIKKKFGGTVSYSYEHVDYVIRKYGQKAATKIND